MPDHNRMNPMSSVRLYPNTAAPSCHVPAIVTANVLTSMFSTRCSRKTCATSRNANVLLKYRS